MREKRYPGNNPIVFSESVGYSVWMKFQIAATRLSSVLEDDKVCRTTAVREDLEDLLNYFVISLTKLLRIQTAGNHSD
jgi:hypothetical protein